MHPAVIPDCFLNFTVLSEPKCSKAFAHAISSICFFCVESCPFSAWQTPTHPERFTLHFHFLSHSFPSSLAELEPAPQSSPCAMFLSYLIESLLLCICLPLSWCLRIWRRWTSDIFAPSSYLSILLLEQCPKFPLGHRPIPAPSPVVDHLF